MNFYAKLVAAFIVLFYELPGLNANAKYVRRAVGKEKHFV